MHNKHWVYSERPEISEASAGMSEHHPPPLHMHTLIHSVIPSKLNVTFLRYYVC